MIGTIGYGRFGKLSVRFLARDFPVVVHTRDSGKEPDIEAQGARLVSLEEACSAKIVLLCVPISAMPGTLQRIAPLIRPRTLVVDVCSVKVRPVEWMRRLLPSNADILATHPMFGPDSAAGSLEGRKIVLCPVRIGDRTYARIKAWLEARGLVTLEATPEEHDRKVADSLALTHFIGRSLSEMGLQPLDIDTEGYRHLLTILAVVANDTRQLFEDMHRYNPFADERRRALIGVMQKISDHLK